MNDHERLAWRRLVEMGATVLELGGKPALDLTSVRPRSARAVSDFLGAALDVAGRSGENRRHVDRRGNPVFVVTDDTTISADVERWQRQVG